MAEGRQIPHHGEAIVLRTWPFHEADLLVSLFTRDQGKVKGVARHAMKSRKRFGGALEPATQVRAHYTERPRQELVRLDSFEIVWSPLSDEIDTLRLAGLQLVVEVLEEAMPELATDDNIYRLAVSVLTAMQSGTPAQNTVISTGASQPHRDAERRNPCISVEASAPERTEIRQQVYLPVTYFCLWMCRLMGWMPELGHCAACGLDLRGELVWWSPTADGVTCKDDCRTGSRALSAASVQESYRIARSPLAELAAEDWPVARCADLRAFAVGTLERHLERRLRSAVALVQ
jgi:DNA repair protein RecO (recombination protein O)